MKTVPTENTVSARLSPMKAKAGMGPMKMKEIMMSTFPTMMVTMPSRPRSVK